MAYHYFPTHPPSIPSSLSPSPLPSELSELFVETLWIGRILRYMVLHTYVMFNIYPEFLESNLYPKSAIYINW